MNRLQIYLWVFAILVSQGIAQTVNTLTPAETAAGWKLMFDGKVMDGWHNYLKPSIAGGWVIDDNAIYRKDAGAGSILAPEAFKYQDFELTVDWKLSDNGNSGIFLRFLEITGQAEGIRTGPECQVAGRLHPDYKDGLTKSSAGAVYDMIPPSKVWIKPAAEYNTFHVVVFGKRIAHFGNKIKLLEYLIDSPEWTALYQVSKYKNHKDYGTVHAGKLYLQDHGNPVWYRNIKIRPLTVDPWTQTNFVWPDGPTTLINPLQDGFDRAGLVRKNSGILSIELPEYEKRTILYSDAQGVRLETSHGTGSWNSTNGSAPGIYFLSGQIGGKGFSRKVVLP